jgi:tripartite-type tricarboxylate transporter receptor subunit TctC
MNKKKVLSMLLASAMTLSLAACSSSTSSSSTTSTAPAESAAAEAVSLPKSIELQLPASAGGGTDVAYRALSSYINSAGLTNMTVVNNTDGNGVVAYETIRSDKGDGSKILTFHSTMIIKYATGIYTHSPADEFKTIAVGLPTEKGGYILVVPAESGITDVDGFIAAAKEKNGSMMIGVETGGSSHIMSGILTQALGIELNYVEAGADTEKLTALVGGSIDCALVNANQAKQYIEAGMVNALACFSATDEGGRNSVLPDVPSFKELGYDCVFGTYFYVLGSTSMSDEMAEAIHDAFAEAAADPDTSALLSSSGFGMEIAPYAEGHSYMEAQQESLVSVCQSLGLAG